MAIGGDYRRAGPQGAAGDDDVRQRKHAALPVEFPGQISDLGPKARVSGNFRDDIEQLRNAPRACYSVGMARLTFALILSSLSLLLLSAQTAPAIEAGRLTLEMLYHPDKKIDFDGTPPRILRWLEDGRHYVERRNSNGDSPQLWRVEAETGASQPLYDRDKIGRAFAALDGISAEQAGQLVKDGDFTLSPDEQTILIDHDDDLYLYRARDDQARRLTANPRPEKEAAFSPDGRRVAFVRDFDLHVLELEDGSERRLTSGGGDNLFNGLLDWVYQEEIYGRGDFKGFWWSPDSRHLAYLQLDESPVPSFTVVDHLPQHLELEVTRYPKAGDANPRPRLGVVAAAGGETVWADLSAYQPDDLLIVRVGYAPDGRLFFQAQNKEQTWLDLNVCDGEKGSVRRLFRETTPAWVDVLDEPHWLDDGSFLWESQRTGWRHLYHYSSQGELLKAVTSGEWEVRDYFGTDEESGWVYFAAAERSPIANDLYRVRLDGSGPARLSQRPGHHAAQFNPQLSRYIDSWNTLNTPTQTRLHGADGEELRVIDDNPSPDLARLQLSPPEFFQVPTRDGFKMEALLIKPLDFDASRRYPVLVFTYGGPHAPQVRNRWGGTTYLWHQMLAQQGYAIWICDNRTASGKGIRPTWEAHRNLGELELRDIEDGLSWLKNQPWVDSGRIGIWGWSYGGYMTAYALTHSTSFKAGIAGAPVTDWRLYDTIYTERYMGTPQNNPEGYQKSSVLEAAANLHGQLLLIHGTIDDNVHMQNSMKFIYELQQAGKQFQLMLYPKNRHGFRNDHQIYHLRTLMTEFIRENL